MTSEAASLPFTNLKVYRRTKSVAKRFFLKKTLRNTLTLGLILALYIYVKAESYIQAYPTVAAKAKLAESLGSNVGIKALLGVGHNIDSLGGFVVWNFLCLITASGAVWAMLFATKTFRGEEESGRSELFLGGQTDLGRLSINIFKAMAIGVALLYALLSLSILAIGNLKGAGFTTSSSLFLSLSLTLGAIEFLAVGALASQIMPTRSRALGLSVFVFGVFYLIRLVADTSSASWLLSLSPLGWVEKLAPMYGTDPIWLIPIGLFVALLVWLTLVTASKRDLGDALLADKQSSVSHNTLLKSPLGLAFRMNRAAILGWTVALSVTAFLYSLLAKGAVQSLSKSNNIGHGLNKLSNNHASLLTAQSFMGIVFLIVMLVGMFFVASAVGRIRSDESKGYLDNFLIRPVSRFRWLAGRIVLVIGAILVIAVAVAIFSWLGQASQHTGLTFHTMALASVNASIPIVLVLGAGIFVLGFAPRLTSSVAYIIIGWSFLLSTLSTGLTLNHWLLDTSILHQVSLSPAVGINWTVNCVILAIAAGLAIIGGLRFNYRDIEGE